MTKLYSAVPFVTFLSICPAASQAQRLSAKRLSPNFHEVSNFRKLDGLFHFQPAHLKALRKNLFFTSPSDDTDLYGLYGRNDYQEIPSIVTSDNVLEIYHVFFESTLRNVEEKSLVGDLRELSREMSRLSTDAYEKLKGTPMEPAAIRNCAYFAVAERMLSEDTDKPLEPPVPARALLEREAASIAYAKGFGHSAIFPYDIDYSQFIARGHYTKSAELSRYFRAMMWYGLSPFAIARRQNGVEKLNADVIRQGLLLARLASQPKAAKLWHKIYDVTALFAGESNNLTPAMWDKESRAVYGNASLNAFADQGRMRQFVARLRKLAPAPIVIKRSSGTTAANVEMRFMGQRAIPDSVILQRLTDNDHRPFPSPLDVFAVLGSRTARTILDQNPGRYNPEHWAGYLPERRRLTAEFARRPKSDWSKNLYWSWFDCLRIDNQPVPASAPKFMQGDAWAKKSLYSSLASWAALRHDTVLYGLQSGAEMGGDPEPELKGYVEPNPALYHRIGELVHQTAQGLKKRGYLDSRLEEPFMRFQGLLGFLESVSERELAGKRLAKEDHQRIRSIEGELESAHNQIQIIANGYEALTKDDLDIALATDVHTAFGQALTVGLGRGDHLFAIVPIEGKLTLTRGSALTYYEFTVPASARMTDKQWKAQLNAHKAPPRPDWVKAFHVPVPLKSRKD